MIDSSGLKQRYLLESYRDVMLSEVKDCEIFEIYKYDEIQVEDIKYMVVNRGTAKSREEGDIVNVFCDVIFVCVCNDLFTIESMPSEYIYLTNFFVLLKDLNKDETSLRSLGIQALKLWQEESDLVNSYRFWDRDVLACMRHCLRNAKDLSPEVDHV
jgi:hypothetical protein